MADLTHTPRPSVGGALYNAIRGALIGLAELVPGVSGGTIALIVGIYERVLDAGNHVLSALKTLVLGPDRWAGFKEEMRKVDWWLLIPMLIGMAAVVLSMAGAMAAFVTETPTLSRGLFLGMVAASVAVPLLMIDWKGFQQSRLWKYLLLFLVAAIAAFLLTSEGSGAAIQDPPLPLVFGAAAIAVCALVLPGVSGSFFLLVIGLYAPTMEAIAERDLVYIGVFGLGAVTGIVLFIRVLHWLMQHHHTATMFGMSGLLLGSLRALWPWQAESGRMLVPGTDLGVVLVLFVVGILVVGVLVYVDRRLTAQADQEADAVEA